MRWPIRSVMIGALVAGLLAAAQTVSSAQAQQQGGSQGQPQGDEPFLRLLAYLSPEPHQSGFVFNYLRRSPAHAGDLNARSIATEINEAMLLALVEGQEATRLTGVDFGRVLAVLSEGVPTDAPFYIAGAPGFASQAPATLVARGFKRQSDAGTLVCAVESPDKDELKIPSADPFGGGFLGSHYCLSATSDVAIVALQFGTPLEAVRHRRAGEEPCPLCDLFARLVTAKYSARGGKGDVVSALGFTITAHAGMAGDDRTMAIMMDPSLSMEEKKARLEAEMKRERKPIPPHGLALLSASRVPDGEVAQMALLYTNRAAAEAAAPVVRSRLEALSRDESRAKPSAIRLTYEPAAEGAVIAVLTLDFPAASNRDGLRELADWFQSTIQRRFTVLDPLQ